MLKESSDADKNQVKSDWQAIRNRMNERRIDPTKLARLAGYSEIEIRKGIGGDPIPITASFLRNAVRAFSLVSARAKSLGEDPLNYLSYEDCMELIRPRPAMPTGERDFWEMPD